MSRILAKTVNAFTADGELITLVAGTEVTDQDVIDQISNPHAWVSDSESEEETFDMSPDLTDEDLDAQYEHLTVPNLRSFAAEHEVDLSGARYKADIVRRLLDAGVELPDAND